ncbi:hypothetical protein HDU88_003279 [Geranomyces variabilis]|nr:hypothetical protein HDU88_003279 [Geranomyces variabilis]
MPDISIRPATLADGPALGVLFCASAIHAYGAFFPPGTCAPYYTHDRHIPRWTNRISNLAPGHQLLVATIPDRKNDSSTRIIAGFVEVGPRDPETLDLAPSTPNVGEIHFLFCDPQFLGAGIGRALLAAGEDALRRTPVATATGASDTEQQFVDTAVIQVFVENKEACAFYERMGYASLGQVRHDKEFKDMGYEVESIWYQKEL